METNQKNPVIPDELPENTQEMTNHDDEIQTLEAADPINPYTRVSLGRDNTNEAIQAFPIYRGRWLNKIIIVSAASIKNFTPRTNLIRVVCQKTDPSDANNAPESKLFFEDQQSQYIHLVAGTVEYFTVRPGDTLYCITAKDEIVYINS